MKKLGFTVLTTVLIGLLTSCASGDFGDCTNLASRYRASDFGFTSSDGTFSETFEEGVLEVGFGEGGFNSAFGAPGFNPVRLTDAPFTATPSTLTLNEPFIDRLEPGAQTFECEVVDDDTFTLRSDQIDFDFNDDGVYEDATFEGTFDEI